MSNLMKMEDLAVEKAQRYGGYFLDPIKAFCKERSWPSDTMPDEGKIVARVSVPSSTTSNEIMLLYAQGSP